MPRTPNTLSALLLGACLGLAACERKLQEENPELTEDCTLLCSALAASDKVDKRSCIDYCVGGLPEAEAVGPACEDAYRDLTSCVGELRDGKATDWWSARQIGVAEHYDYPCEDETTPFLELCPGVWYNE